MNSIFKSERSLAILLLAVASLCWSLGGILIKSVDWNPLAIAGIRSGISSIILMLYLKKPRFTWSKAQIGAALAYVATVFLFVSATKLTTAANAILLQFTAPIYVALFGSWLLKEKTSLLDWISIVTVLGGMALFFFDHLSLQGTVGNIIATASGVSFAFLTIFMRMQKDESPLESVLLGNIFTFFIGLPFIFQSGPGPSDWVYLVILGVIQLGFPYILYSWAIKHVSAIDAILIPVIEPLLNPVWVFIFIGETPGSWALLGGIIVISSITIRFLLPVLNAKKSTTTGNLRQID